MVTIAGLVVSLAYWALLSPAATEAMATARRGGTQLKWRPTTHLQWWFAMLGGAVAFLHYFFLLKAFESAPSTVLLPLVQVASVSVLLGSSVVALYRHEAWITPTHALAYVLMFIGGVLPACAGQLSLLLQRSFWRQKFVFYAICAEFAIGLHDLMLSGCAYNAGAAAAPPLAEGGAAAEGGGGGEDTAESFEFFVWSRGSFVLTFGLMYSCSAALNAELRDLLSGSISSKYVALSAISEGLTILGFYLASIAYGLFYQAGIVHAAEASLSQLLNLALAVVLLRCFGLGRSSAVEAPGVKLASFVMVTIGLFLCTLEDAPKPKPKPVAAAGLAAAGAQADALLAAGRAAAPGAADLARRMMRRRL